MLIRMDAPERGALMLVRFVAAALIGWSVVELALDWAIHQHQAAPVTWLTSLGQCLPLLAGIVLLLKSRSLAEWISDKLDS